MGAVAVALFILGCGRLSYDVLVPIERDASVDAGAAEGMPWGEYAAGLPVPECPPAPVLLVNSLGVELDGGEGLDDPAMAGSELSFVEAMWIASNREGPDTILFDAGVFPVDRPSLILVPGNTPLPIPGPVCIDGRGRGVIVDWDTTDLLACASCAPILTSGSLMVGITVWRMPYEIAVGGAQVAGCRFRTDGTRVLPSPRPWALDLGSLADTVVGPGNVFAGQIAVRTPGERTHVHGNHFGFDPTTNQTLQLDTGIDIRGTVGATPAATMLIEDNVFAATSHTLQTRSFEAVDIVFRDNWVGVRPDGEPLGEGLQGLSIDIGLITVGPNNRIEGVTRALYIGRTRTGESPVVRITRNSITGNDDSIVHDIPPLAPPVIDAATVVLVRGTCSPGAEVEVFVDPEDQGETYVGVASCGDDGRFTLGARLPGGSHATATQTDTMGRTSAFSAPMPVP